MALLRGTVPPRWASLKDRRRQTGLGAHPLAVTDYIRNLMGLVRLYPMQEGVPNQVLDYGPENRHGALIGPGTSLVGRIGSPGRSYQFGGDGDHILTPVLDMAPGPFTVGLRVKLETNGGLVTSWDAINDGPAMYLAAGDLVFYAAGVTTIFSSLDVLMNIWQWVFFRSDDGVSVECLLDGTLASESDTYAALDFSEAPFDIANYAFAGTSFNGHMAQVFVLDRAITDDEIAVIVQLSVSPYVEDWLLLDTFDG